MSGSILEVLHESVWAKVRESVSGPLSWQLGHARLVRVGKRRGELDAEEAVWLVVCEALGAHRQLGYGTLVEYVSAVVGWDAHSAMERIRVARALVKLPRVYDALAEGTLSWSAARELTRVVTPATEAEWLGACASASVRDVQRLVSGRRPGDLPSTPADESARRHVVRFEVSGATLALLRQAEDEQRRRTGESVEDDAMVAALARAFLAGEGAAGGAGAHVTVELCPSCRRGTAEAGGERVALSPSELERHACDARVLPASREAAVRGERDGASTSHAVPDTSHEGGESPEPAWSAELERRAGLKIATELPKTVRAAVLRRHGGRCAMPGCSNTAFLDVHHVDLRSEGGTHDPERLVPLCDVHHRCVHEGKLVVGGAWSSGFVFKHADGTPYGTRELPDPRVSHAAEVVLGALRNLGFEASDAQRSVDAIRARIEADMPLGEVLRMALQATPSPSQCYRNGVRVRESVEAYLPSWAAA